MAWIESHQTLGSHRKLFRLARTLNIQRPQAVGHLHYLWWWALDAAPDGDLSSLTPAEIAGIAVWLGEPEAFVAALRECGFLDPDGKIHDWQDYAGRITALREANRERQRRRRTAARDKPVTRDGSLKSRAARRAEPNTRHAAEAHARHAAGSPVCHGADAMPRHVAESRACHGATQPNPTQPDPTQPDPVSVSPTGAAIPTDSCTEDAPIEETHTPQAGTDHLWPTLEETRKRADMRGISRECAEKWWHLNDSRGGCDSHGQPIRRWESSLIAFAATWRAVESQQKSRTDSQAPARRVITAEDHAKGFFHNTPFEKNYAEAEARAQAAKKP